MNTLAYSPLTDLEIYDRCDQARAEYAASVLHTKHVVADPETICDRTPRSMRLRAEREAKLESEAVHWEAVAEQRLFQGRITDWQRAVGRVAS